MTKREHFLRYIAIIKKLRNHQLATYDEIVDYLERDAEINDYHTQMSKRTFQRDLQEILSLFNIEIKYDYAEKAYRMAESEDQRDMNHRMLEALDILNLCNISEKASPWVIFENRRPAGTGHFNALLHAIQTRKQVRFVYEKFYDAARQTRLVEPYALKESHNRWYLLAKDLKDFKVKTFGLDRISEVNISTQEFDAADAPDPALIFRDCFGVLGDGNHPPEEVILSITPTQGKYIKSFPLHTSQKIIVDDEKELRISLQIFLSTDFIIELFSLGDTLRVIAPVRLRELMIKGYTSALRNYED